VQQLCLALPAAAAAAVELCGCGAQRSEPCQQHLLLLLLGLLQQHVQTAQQLLPSLHRQHVR
jgi:hypothetical protein